MATRTAAPLHVSFQPWSRKQAGEGALQDTLARVSDERGHFRDITEASLQEELAGEGALELSDSESEEEEEDNEEDHAQSRKGKPLSREELFKAKQELLANVRAAEQEVLMSLDFVSLLLSAHAPKQAQNTISPVLKEAVPLGSLGIDIWHNMKPDTAQEAQSELLATNVRMQGLQHSADNLLAAASRLETNVRNETQYWNQILSISQEGWNVCRIPGQQHRLGVSFGFSESAPEFSRRGLAALNISAQGDIVLERGVGTRPKSLRAVLRTSGQIVGRSKLPQVSDVDNSTLEARIRYARDSLFDEELYHEIIRESRIIASLGVRMAGSAIEFGQRTGFDSGIEVSLDLLSLDEDHGSSLDASTEQDALADAVVLAARLLLGQAHREKLKKRSEIPPPMSEKNKDERPVMPILRPIMSFILHRSALDELNGYVTRLAQTLDNAQIQNNHALARPNLPEHAEITNSDILITTLMQPWTSTAKLTVLDAKSNETITLNLGVETTLAQGFGSRFTLAIPQLAQTYQVDAMDEFISATDAKVACQLASALSEAMGGDWTVLPNESLILRDVGMDEREQALLVSVDSGEKMVSLSSPEGKDKKTKDVVWKVGGENLEKGFWNAKDDVLSV